MKKIAFELTAVVLILLVPRARVFSQEPVEKKSAHIMIVTVKDGEKQVIDTVISGKDIKMFHPGCDKAFSWTSNCASAEIDSLFENIEEFPEGGKKIKKVMVMKHEGLKEPVFITETETEGDSGKKIIVHVERVSPGEEDLMIHRPGFRSGDRMIRRPGLPGKPLVFMDQHRGNVISLTDPGIISYKKKKLSGGKEKIIIIRNEMKESEAETFNFQFDEGRDLKRMNAPRVVREFEIQKNESGETGPLEKKLEIETE